jgi:hypothetical protein
MLKNLLLFLVIFSTQNTPSLCSGVRHTNVLKQEHYHIKGKLTTTDCKIVFVHDDVLHKDYVVKHIKDPNPDEQFLLVIDTLACYIAQNLGVRINAVEVHAPGTFIAQITNKDFPATLHELVYGEPLGSSSSCYNDIDIHQRKIAKEGTQCDARRGLTLNVIQSMARHPDLPSIVAFDTFVGNADRSQPNIFYDQQTDHFCGIDLSASWCSLLGFYALRNLQTLEAKNYVFSDAERVALKHYAATLRQLLQQFSPESCATLLDHFANQAGFCRGSNLYNQDVEARICFHKNTMVKNYEHCADLVQFLHSRGF